MLFTRPVINRPSDLFTRWQPKGDDPEPWLELDFGKPETSNAVVCGEFDQLLDAFKVEAKVGGQGAELAHGDKMTWNYHANFPGYHRSEISTGPAEILALVARGGSLVPQILILKS